MIGAQELIDIILVLAGASLLAILPVTRLGLSPVLGYLVVGLLAGPNGVGWIETTQQIHALAELGVIFLMFTIGLQFSLPRLLADQGRVLGLGGLQVAVSTALFAAVGQGLGLSAAGAFTVAVALAMSSTAVVSRQMLEQGMLTTRVGQTAVGVLLFQDLATVLALLVLPAIGHGAPVTVASRIVAATAQGAAVFVVVLVVGRWAVRPLFRRISMEHSPELFMLAVVLVSLGAARFAQWAGLSPILGGFLAGMVLGETEFRHQVEADVRPFQDVLLGVFFISIGTLVDLSVLVGFWPQVLAVTGGLMLVKAAVVMGLARLTGLTPVTALRTGLLLAQGGEFGLVIIYLGLDRGLVTDPHAQVVLSAILLSMVLAPLMIRANAVVAQWALGGSGAGRVREGETAQPTAGLESHVIVCGYGRVGQSVGRLLEQEGFPFVALDLDPDRVREAAAAGERVTYGDVTQRSLLSAAGLERAQAVVITFKDTVSALRAVSHIHELRPDAPVLARAADETYLEELLDAGVTEVIPDTLEASMSLATHLLLVLGVPVGEVARRSELVRSDRYRMLRGLFHGRERGARDRLQVVRIGHQAYAVGRRLGDMVLERYGVRVHAVRRRGIRGQDPSPDMRVQAGDVLIIRGAPSAVARAERFLLAGQP